MRISLTTGLCLLALAACADAPPEGDALSSTAPSSPREVRFTARDFAFDGPSTIEAGMVTLVLANEGPMLHHVQLVRLSEGKTPEDFAAALATMQPGQLLPSWAVEAGGVNPPDPGAEARVTMMLEAGSYVVVCFVDLTDHVPHFAKGMTAPLTVTASSAGSAEAPASTLSLTLADYAFGFSAPPMAGEHVLRVENAGPQPHEIALFRLHDGKTMDEFMQFAVTYEGEMPASSIGGVPGIAPGDVAYVHLNLLPGNYVALCFLVDVNDGKMHAEHGMVLPFQVS